MIEDDQQAPFSEDPVIDNCIDAMEFPGGITEGDILVNPESQEALDEISSPLLKNLLLKSSDGNDLTEETISCLYLAKECRDNRNEAAEIYELLGKSIVYAAVEDYIITLYNLWRSDGNRIKRIVDEIELETFFGSRWYWQLTNINPERIMNRCWKHAEEASKLEIRKENREIVKAEIRHGV